MITFPSIDSKTELIFNQFFGIGDILFIEPIMRRFFQEGYKINLPILKIYLPIQHYFPYINFIEQENYKIKFHAMIEEADHWLKLAMKSNRPDLIKKAALLWGKIIDLRGECETELFK